MDELRFNGWYTDHGGDWSSDRALRGTWCKPGLAGVGTPTDLVQRQFTANRPNELWCTDITEHPARDGPAACHSNRHATAPPAVHVFHPSDRPTLYDDRLQCQRPLVGGRSCLTEVFGVVSRSEP